MCTSISSARHHSRNAGPHHYVKQVYKAHAGYKVENASSFKIHLCHFRKHCECVKRHGVACGKSHGMNKVAALHVVTCGLIMQFPGVVVYNISKAGLDQLTRTAALGELMC